MSSKQNTKVIKKYFTESVSHSSSQMKGDTEFVPSLQKTNPSSITFILTPGGEATLPLHVNTILSTEKLTTTLFSEYQM